MSFTVRRRFRPAVPALAIVLLAGTAGCSAARPDLAPPAPTGEAAAACESLYEALPERVEDQDRWMPPEETRYAAAWGDPAIVLRCGVPRPALLTPETETYDPFADAVEVNGVSWLLEEQEDGYLFTTTDRAVLAEVSVPGAYAPEVGALVDVAEAVEATLPLDPLYEDPHSHH
ncbi:DUF3515 domain-containing protein [Streptomyces sp. ACA25]|uniref:DUF3515 domain-containing protein n=1 Tax=Streptomyces sp. ACA25 TaxID=3022596 RepID=UPI002307F4C7|nr:DUF3515 domain-containing protein [Streptomyces sp. ACA25]MDB1089614.1 DUF3515 domain-containing protein [Streptomyces sp. ACA25]